MLKWISQSSAWTSCCSFFARLRIIVPSKTWDGVRVGKTWVVVVWLGACDLLFAGVTLGRCSGFWGSDVMPCTKLSQNFSTSYTWDVMTPHKVLRFFEQVWIFYNLKHIPHRLKSQGLRMKRARARVRPADPTWWRLVLPSRRVSSRVFLNPLALFPLADMFLCLICIRVPILQLSWNSPWKIQNIQNSGKLLV